MSETKETSGGKTIRGSRTMTLNLKRTVDAGHVRQNFSHGRSKSVLVEKKKKRVINSPGEAEAAPQETEAPTSEAAEAPADPALRNLSSEERDARARALNEAKTREVEETKRRAEEEARRKEEEARLKEQEASQPAEAAPEVPDEAAVQAEAMRNDAEAPARRKPEPAETAKAKERTPIR